MANHNWQGWYDEIQEFNNMLEPTGQAYNLDPAEEVVETVDPGTPHHGKTVGLNHNDDEALLNQMARNLILGLGQQNSQTKILVGRLAIGPINQHRPRQESSLNVALNNFNTHLTETDTGLFPGLIELDGQDPVQTMQPGVPSSDWWLINHDSGTRSNRRTDMLKFQPCLKRNGIVITVMPRIPNHTYFSPSDIGTLVTGPENNIVRDQWTEITEDIFEALSKITHADAGMVAYKLCKKALDPTSMG